MELGLGKEVVRVRVEVGVTVSRTRTLTLTQVEAREQQVPRLTTEVERLSTRLQVVED